MTRPRLQEMPLSEAWPPRAGELTVTMAEGQWSGLLQAAYNAGSVLVELDEQERPVRAYQKATVQ